MSTNFIQEALNLLRQHRFQEAIKVCRRGLLIEPSSSEGRIILASSLMALRRFDEARHELAMLLKDNPDLVIVHRLLSEVYINLGDYKKAKEEIGIVESINPQEPFLIQLKSQLSLLQNQKLAQPVTVEQWIDDPKTMNTFTETIINLHEGLDAQEVIKNFNDMECTDSFTSRAEISLVDEKSAKKLLDSEFEETKAGKQARELPKVSPYEDEAETNIEEISNSSLETHISSPQIPIYNAVQKNIEKVEQETKILAQPNIHKNEINSNQKSVRELPPISSHEEDLPTGIIDNRYDKIETKDDMASKKPLNDPLEKPFWPKEFDEFTFSIQRKDIFEGDNQKKGVKTQPISSINVEKQNQENFVNQPISDLGTQKIRTQGSPIQQEQPQVINLGLNMPPPPVQNNVNLINQKLPEINKVDKPISQPQNVQQFYQVPINKPQETFSQFVAKQKLQQSFPLPPIPLQVDESIEPDEQNTSYKKPFPRKKKSLSGMSWDSWQQLISSISSSKKKVLLPGEETKKWKFVVVTTMLVFVILLSILFGVIYSQKRKVNFQINQAKIYMIDGNYQGYKNSLKTYKELMQISNNDIEYIIKSLWINSLISLEFGDNLPSELEQLIKSAKAKGQSSKFIIFPLTNISLVKGNLGEAEKLLAGKIPEDYKEFSPEIHYLKGIVYYRKSNFTLALREFDAAMKAAPRELRYQLYIVKVYLAQDNYNTALDLLNELENLSHDNIWRKVLQGKILIQNNINMSKGEEIIRNILENESSIASKGQIGWAYLCLGLLSAINLNFDTARQHIKMSLENNPYADPEFNAFLSQIYLKIGEPMLARLQAEEALKINKEKESYSLLLAESLIEENKLNEAESTLLKLDNSSQRELLLGRIYFLQGKHSVARSRISPLINGNNELAQKAKLYNALIDFKEGELDKAIQQLQFLIRNENKVIAAYSYLAEAYIQKNDLPNASKVIEEAETLTPNDFKIFITKGKLAMKEGRIDDAEVDFEKAVKLSPNSTIASNQLADYYVTVGNYERAVDIYDKTLKINPSESLAMLGKSIALASLDRYEEANNLITQAIQKGVSFSKANYVKGKLELNKFRPSSAESYLENEKDNFLYDPIFWSMLGDAYSAKAIGDNAKSYYTKALNAYKKALKIDINIPDAIVGIAELESNRNPQSLKSWSQYINKIAISNSISPRLKARAIFLKGRVAYDYGEYSDVRNYANEALKIDKNFAPAYYYLGLVEEDDGTTEGACQYYKEYLKIAPEGVFVREAKKGETNNCE